jgi:hypothetical protein
VVIAFSITIAKVSNSASVDKVITVSYLSDLQAISLLKKVIR